MASNEVEKLKEMESQESGYNRCVPNWLVEVLAWIKRTEMADTALSTSSLTFKQLCWPKLHGNVKQRKMADLTFFHGRYELGKARAFVRTNQWPKLMLNTELVPIASIPPPDYIIGTEGIEIEGFVDATIYNFIKNVAHLFENCKFTLRESIMEWKGEKIVLLWNALKCLKGKIFELDLPYNCVLNDFNNLFFGVLDHVQSLKFNGCNLQTDFLLKWLANPRSDKEPKLIKMTNFDLEYEIALIERIKEEFLQTNLPSRFTVYVSRPYFNQIGEFILENERTNEILALYSKKHVNDFQCRYLARYPKGEQGEEEVWKEEGERKIWHRERGISHSSAAIITIYNKCIN